MDESIWAAPLGELREKVAGLDPVPAGVAISAVTASLALALLAKVLEIVRKRRTFEGDPHQMEALLEAVRRESFQLTLAADADVHAFNRYLECVRNKEDAEEAMRDAIRVPLEAARTVARGLALCREAEPHCQTGMTASDFRVAEALLSGAMRGMVLSVESNLRQLAEDDSFRHQIAGELRGFDSHLRR